MCQVCSSEGYYTAQNYTLISRDSSVIGVRPQYIFFVIPFYLQSVPVYSANCVKTYTVACIRVLSRASL
jgi:hypothetical protein